jgi:hypothetical protein
LTWNGRVWAGFSYANLLFKRNSFAGSFAVEDLFDSRLGRIADEYSRLVNLNSYRLQQLRVDRFACDVDHTALTASLPDAVTVATNTGFFEDRTTLVSTKSTFGGDLSHPVVNSWVLSDPIVGVSRLVFFEGNLSGFTRNVYPNRLAFETTGDALLQAELIRPKTSVVYYKRDGLFLGMCIWILTAYNPLWVLYTIKRRCASVMGLLGAS